MTKIDIRENAAEQIREMPEREKSIEEGGQSGRGSCEDQNRDCII